MPRMNPDPFADVSGLPHTRPEEQDPAGLEGRDEPEAVDVAVGEGASVDVPAGIVAILDSLEQWQQSRKDRGS